MVTMRVTLTGVPQTRAMLNRVKEVLSDMRPGLTDVGEYLLHLFSVDAFESEGAIYGRKWAPLNPHYALWKSTNYPGRGILERSGTMRRGFRATTARTYLLIKNSVEYLAKHQKGEGVPQRVVVDLQRHLREHIEDLLRADIISRLKGAR